jgi:vitamin B12 transporter
LHIGLNGSHIGERFENVYGVGKKETGNYTLLNAVANYDLDDTSRLYLKIENLGNIDYQTAYGYATADRSYYLGISAAF